MPVANGWAKGDGEELLELCGLGHRGGVIAMIGEGGAERRREMNQI